MLPGISREEATWLLNTVNRGINGFVEAAATAHQWTFVGGIFDDFAGHGYCADDSWLRRIQDSFRLQGTKEGTIHPTAAGHAVYADHIELALLSTLYLPAGGAAGIGAPRTPNLAYSTQHDTAPPVVAGVPNRAANAAGWYSGSVVIDWQATDPAPSSGPPTDPPDTIAATEGSGVVYPSDPSCDPIGSCATGSLSLSIDTTLPALTCQSPAPVFTARGGGGHGLGSGGRRPLRASRRDRSGVAATTSVGAKTVSLTGQDVAGNARTVSCPYTVAYAFGGFLSPVDEGGVLNVVKAGRAIPHQMAADRRLRGADRRADNSDGDGDEPGLLGRGQRRSHRGDARRGIRPAEPRGRLLPAELEDADLVCRLVQDDAPQSRRGNGTHRDLQVHQVSRTARPGACPGVRPWGSPCSSRLRAEVVMVRASARISGPTPSR